MAEDKDPLVGQLLLDKGVAKDDVKALVVQFEVKDISNVSDLGDSDAAASAAIDAALGKTSIAPATQTKIKAALLEARNAQKGTPAAPAGGQAGAANPTTIKAALDTVTTVSDTDRKAVAAKFAEQKVVNVIDLGTANPTAKIKAVVEAVITDQTAREALEKAVLDAWTAATSPAAPAGPAAPTVVTTLPDAPIDLSKWPTLRAEGASIGAFTIPDLLKSAPAGDPPVRYADVLDWQWLRIAGNNGLVKAINLRALAAGNDNPWADLPAFQWKKGDGAVNPPPKELDVDSLVDASQFESLTSSALIVKSTLSGNYLFCAGSIKGSAQVDHTGKSYSKRIYTRCRAVVRKCDLVLANCLVPSPAFVFAVRRALGIAADGRPGMLKTVAEKYSALHLVFEVFGHVIPHTVRLGGVLEIVKEIVSLETLNLDKAKIALDAAATVKTDPDPAKAPLAAVELGFALDDTGSVANADYADHYHFSANGGDTTLWSQPDRWARSLNLPSSWIVIVRDGARPIHEQLSSDLQDEIEKLRRCFRKTAWLGETVLKALGEETNPETPLKNDNILPAQELPFFAPTARVTLRNWGAGVTHPFLSTADGRLSTELTPAEAQPSDPLGKDSAGNAAAPVSQNRVKGKSYTWCQPTPRRGEVSDGDSPGQHNLFWRIVHTGTATAALEPEFWIVSDDGKNALTAFEQVGTDDQGNEVHVYGFATLLPIDEALKSRTDAHPAKWVLRPAVPPGTLQFEWENGSRRSDAWHVEQIDPTGQDRNYVAGYFMIWNPKIAGYLADEAMCGSRRTYVVHHPMEVVANKDGPRIHPAYDQTIEDAGPMFTRCMVRGTSNLDLGSIYDLNLQINNLPNPNYGKPNKARQAAQEANFKTHCWLIQDWSGGFPAINPRDVQKLKEDIAAYEAAQAKAAAANPAPAPGAPPPIG